MPTSGPHTSNPSKPSSNRQLSNVCHQSMGDRVSVRPARSPTNPRPLVKIVTRGAGWYTVLVQRDFDVTEASDFTVQYGRYNAGNSNCAIPTQPKLSQQAPAMGLTGMQEADAAREARRERRNAIRVTPSAEVPERL